MAMAITAKMVAELRAKTDAPMMECKKALTEAEGDFEKAEELLRVKLGSKAGKAASRVTAEGVVTLARDGDDVALVEINCETDFVTKNDSFLAFANAVAEGVVKNNPADLAALGAMPLAMDSFGPTVEDVRRGLIGKIGENMTVRRFKRFADGKSAAYLHGTRIGVVVEFEGDEAAAKDVAMHVAAMKPVALSSADVPAELVAKERSVAAAKAAEDASVAQAAGKTVQSAEIVAKRIEGGVQKYLKEVSLNNQTFVKNDKQTVEQMLKEKAPPSNRSRCMSSAKASKRRSTTSLPKSPRRSLPPRAPKPSGQPEDRFFIHPPHHESLHMPAYKRILLKLSGEALMGDDAFRHQPRVTSAISSTMRTMVARLMPNASSPIRASPDSFNKMRL